MDDAFLMGCFESFCDLKSDFQSIVYGKRTSARYRFLFAKTDDGVFS